MDHTAFLFFRIIKRLIEEGFQLDVDLMMWHLNIVGDVVNLVPVYWITEGIMGSSPLTSSRSLITDVKADLYIKYTTNPTGDLTNVKGAYRPFSETTKYICEHRKSAGLGVTRGVS